MEKIEKFEWKEELSVDIPEIDELQKKMFALLNVLIDLKDNDKDGKECSNMVAELNEYSKYFFSKEEEYLRRCGYPEIDYHAKEHRKFVKNAISLRRQVTEDKENLSYEVIIQLQEWLVQHIMTSDLLYVPFLRTTNYIKESKK